ncbi:uncharacterized protein [Centroberyx affinis]|uniref:uncharacterized protein n=1 Tax=Centroberyx affinis TaxID=166261 RepID=UPI003A5BD1EA
MKPVSYPKMTSSLNGGHKDLGLDCLLSTSKVMYCEKCGFVSTDTTVFKNHMLEHMGTRFYCFYCNNVSYSEAELHVHLEQHTTKYPYKCQHCGRGYMRRQCLLKHVERFHVKASGQGLNKPDMTKITHVPVSSALPRVPSAEASSVRPTVKVTIPTTITPPARLGKDRQGGKTVDINVPSVSKVDAELFSPLNDLVQHNRALTVSLPEEVTIPAGCLVELVEVKTVNGTKELKLRLVSQQENGSVIKDSRTTISQNTTLGKPLSTTLNNPNAMKFASMGMCTVNRKQGETKNLNVQRPTVIPTNVAKNIPIQVSKEKSAIKRTLQEMMNLNVDSPAVVPTKVSKSILNPMREGNCGIKITQRETVNLHAAPPVIIPAKTASQLPGILNPGNMGMCVSQRPMGEKKNLIPGHPTSFPPRMISDMKRTPQDLQVAVKEEPREIRPKDSTTSHVAVGQKLQSLKSASPSMSVHLTGNAPGRSSALLVCKDNVTADPSFLMSHIARRTPIDPLLTRQPKVEGGSALTDSKTTAWTQAGRCSERVFERDTSEPEGFPVISSVFSLSQQPGDVQGSIQPLVMALRGIVMSKNNCSVTTTPDHIKTTNVITGRMEDPLTSGYCAQVATKDVSFNHKQLLPQESRETVKIEDADKCVQHTQTLTENHDIKEETNSAITKDNKCSQSPAPKAPPSVTQQEAMSTIASHTDASVTEGPLQQTPESPTSEQDISARFLTVSLKRIQVGLWKQSKKRLKLRKMSKSKTQAPMGGLIDSGVLHPTPLKEDQLVKRPGPNQPVVVLNHPKPQVPKRGARATTVADTGTSEVVPKCQILKMRLSKVMGQKYEVMGCTVRVFP